MIADADSVEEVAAGFVRQALDGAGQVIAAASEAAEERSHPLVAERPESISQLPPGEV
jgi:hypothetical protein